MLCPELIEALDGPLGRLETFPPKSAAYENERGLFPVAESVVGYSAGAGLCEEPSVGDAEQLAGSLGVDQREACRLDTAASM